LIGVGVKEGVRGGDGFGEACTYCYMTPRHRKIIRLYFTVALCGMKNCELIRLLVVAMILL